MKFRTGKIAAKLENAGAIVSAVFSRLPLLWHGFGALIIGLLLARWTWVLFAPHAMAVPPAKNETAGERSAALFGTVATSAVAAATASVLPNVRLLGVYTGKQGFAIFRLDEKKQLGVALGEEVAKGSRLVEVAADYVLIEHNGTRQRVNLEKKFADSKGMIVERSSLAAVPNAQQAAAEWNQARQEMQKGLVVNEH